MNAQVPTPAAALAGLLRPPACPGCGRAGGWPCCAACLPPAAAGAGPWRLAADPGVTLWALGVYRGGLRAAVLAGKLGGQAGVLEALGWRLGVLLAAAGAGADLVTWVGARRWPAGGWRPRDHAERVAAGVALGLEVPAVRLLKAVGGRDLGRARGSGRAVARGELRATRRLAGGRVLVVDDVATAGATLAAAAAALRRAGAASVEAAVLGAAPAAFGLGRQRVLADFARLRTG